MEQHRGLDLPNFRGRRLRPIECYGRCQIASHTHRERVGDSAAEAETDNADFPATSRTVFEPARRGQEILSHLCAVYLLEGFCALLVISGIPADAREPIGSECDEIFGSEAARHVLY